MDSLYLVELGNEEMDITIQKQMAVRLLEDTRITLKGEEDVAETIEIEGSDAQAVFTELLAGDSLADEWGTLFEGMLSFAYYEFGEDHIPVLIVSSYNATAHDVVRAYQYIDGGIKIIGRGPGIPDIYPELGIIKFTDAGTGELNEYYYKISNEDMSPECIARSRTYDIYMEDLEEDELEMMTYAEKSAVPRHSDDTYLVKGRKTSNERFDSFIEELLSGTEAIEIEFHENNDENRIDFLR